MGGPNGFAVENVVVSRMGNTQLRAKIFRHTSLCCRIQTRVVRGTLRGDIWGGSYKKRVSEKLGNPLKHSCFQCERWDSNPGPTD